MVLYCGGGFRSALAADNLQKMGFRNVLSMDGGIREWREKGLPLTEDRWQGLLRAILQGPLFLVTQSLVT